MNVGSMTVTAERASLFNFSPAYYYTPASIAVNAENTSIQDLTTDLDGKKICVGSSTTYESYLEQQLNIPGYTFDYVIDDPQIITYATDTDALDNLALGDGARCDAAMTALPTIDQYIADGGAGEGRGRPVVRGAARDRLRQGVADRQRQPIRGREPRSSMRCTRTARSPSSR